MFIVKSRGQEAIEFILITALVFFAAIFTVSVFGNKIAAFFTSDSAIAKTASQTTNTLNTTQDTKYNPDYDTIASNNASFLGPPSTTTQLAGYDVTENTDGSISVMIGNQNVTITQDILSLQDIVTEATGASGKELLIKEIAYMIDKHKDKYPDGNVPIELYFGDGNRKGISGSNFSEYKGQAIVNTTAIIVENEMIILQTDQECNSNYTDKEYFKGNYRIEGSIDSSSNFKANVTSENQYNPKGPYTAKVDLSNGLNLTNSNFTQTDNLNGSIKINYTWNINFDNPDYKFSLNNLATQIPQTF